MLVQPFFLDHLVMYSGPVAVLIRGTVKPFPPCCWRMHGSLCGGNACYCLVLTLAVLAIDSFASASGMLGIPGLHHYGDLETCGFDLYLPSVGDGFLYILAIVSIVYVWRSACSHPLPVLRLGYLAVLKTELALKRFKIFSRYESFISYLSWEHFLPFLFS